MLKSKSSQLTLSSIIKLHLTCLISFVPLIPLIYLFLPPFICLLLHAFLLHSSPVSKFFCSLKAQFNSYFIQQASSNDFTYAYLPFLSSYNLKLLILIIYMLTLFETHRIHNIRLFN